MKVWSQPPYKIDQYGDYIKATLAITGFNVHKYKYNGEQHNNCDTAQHEVHSQETGHNNIIKVIKTKLVQSCLKCDCNT